MPAITDAPPADVAQELAALRVALDEHIPARALDTNLLIATWNLRAFGGLTESWAAAEHDSPKRDLHALRAIAEIVSRFDVIAIQEVKGDLKALRHILKALNAIDPHWGLILTDVTRGSAGNDERLAFVFDMRRLKPSGLACELVEPQSPDGGAIGEHAYERQFARTPYAVSFLASGITFILVTLHVIYGSASQDRVGELQAIADWMLNWATDLHSWDHNLIALGDFNIDRKDDPLYQAFTSRGLKPPPELEGLPRTIFDKPEKQHFYDQIAWFHGEDGGPELSLEYTGKGGNFDFVPHVFPGMDHVELSWRVSDHYPLWCEFSVRE
ncbi:MAG: endonuclease/exonuclease/phosphatase family protein [Nitrolancea sp.]